MRAILFGLMLPIFSLAPVGRAFGQDFTLTPSALTPAQVDGGVSATATINVQPAAAMTAPTVALSCTVAPVETDGPVCQPSSSSVVAPATAGLTVTTSGTTPEVLYTITFTGTDASGSRSVTFDLGVVAAIGDFALTITSPLSPSSVPAGSGATGTITLTPLNGYNGHMITLACSSVTPPVIPSPQCSFSPTPVLISSGATTAMITVTTAGPNSTTTQLGRPRIFFAAWLLIPSVLLAGLGSAGARRRKLLGGLLLLTLAASLLLIPACGGSTTTNPPTSVGGITGTTPNNTYTFTVTGADENGLVPSTPPTVSLTVTGG